MINFEQRIRLMMERENLSYAGLAEYADASTQAVHKWLNSGSISDEKAMTLAYKLGLDWLWLKHGVSRVPVESLHDIVLCSTSNLYLNCWNTLEIVALGDKLLTELDYQADELVGRKTIEFVPGGDPGILLKGQKILFALSGMVGYSYRANIQDKHHLRAVEVRNKALTTDDQGMTYSLAQIDFVEPNGHENKMSSFRLQRRSWQALNPVLIETLCEANSDITWLQEFLTA